MPALRGQRDLRLSGEDDDRGRGTGEEKEARRQRSKDGSEITLIMDDLSSTSIAELAALLRRPVTDERVIDFFGPLLLKVRRRAYYGFIELKKQGLDVVFNKAPWVVPPSEIVDRKLLYLCAFHFHRKDHQGYSEYLGKLPNGVAFGESKQEVLNKLG